MTAPARDPFAPVVGADTMPRHSREERAWQPVLPIPDDAPPMPAAHPTLGRPVATWCYRDEDGRPIAYELRFRAASGAKETRPLTYCEQADTGRRSWRWQAPAAPRPIYGRDRLAERPDAPVVIVEGPKSADAAAERWPDVVAVSAYGGAQGARHCEVSALYGRDVTVWPDADAAGAQYAATVAAMAREAGAARVRVVALPDGLPEGWDLADAEPEGLDGARLRELLGHAPEAEIETEIEGDADDTGRDTPRGRATVADALVALGRAAELWHTPGGVAYSTATVDGHAETHAVGSRAHRRWLTRVYYARTGRAPAPDAERQAVGVLDARAQYDGDEHDVYLRVAPTPEGGMALDLADAAWRAVVVDASGWRVVDRPPVRMRRAVGMHALPTPERGGSLAELADVLGLVEGPARVLAIGWLLAALRPRGPYPVLILHGEQGSGKSTLARMLRRLIDPSAADLRAQPRDDRDLAIAAENGWTIALDNLSGTPAWLSDALCRLATGGGYATRTLYSDTDETILDAQRPIVVTGIDLVAHRGDLLDRAMTVTLPRVDEYTPERELWRRYDAARPRLLGALLDAVALALLREAETPVPDGLRMVDAARWVAAAEPACPWRAGEWVATYADARAEAWRTEADASAVATAVLGLVGSSGTWEGTATELLSSLADVAGERVSRARTWPRAPRALSAELRRLAPALRGLGVEAECRRAHEGRRVWRLMASGAGIRPSPASPSSPSADIGGGSMGYAGGSGDDGRDRPSPSAPSASPDAPEGDAREEAETMAGVDRLRITPRNRRAGDDGDAGDAKSRASEAPAEPPGWWEDL